jgi:ribosome biogenesis GTPase / thiamine phosphate phosphatase
MGWSERWQALRREVDPGGTQVARVARSEGTSTVVWTADGEDVAHIPGRLKAPEDRPVVGDWVLVGRTATEELRVEVVLQRRTAFVRRAAGRRAQIQVVAANVDVVFVVSSLDGDFAPRRIERYLTAVHEAGAEPVILLTKARQTTDPDDAIRRAQSVAPGVPVHAIDVVDGFETDAPRPYLVPGRTAALVGSSGVGKSTLVNFWLGEDRQQTESVREHDHRGRHTTTARELFALPWGALVVDTPGMRELALWADESALVEAFGDIGELAAGCRFRDCRHEAEPECAIRAALGSGELDADRFASYLQLREEIEQTRALMPEHAQRERGRIRTRAGQSAKRLKQTRR